MRKLTLGIYPTLSLAKAAELSLRVADEGDIVVIDRRAAAADAEAEEQQSKLTVKASLTFADLVTDYVADRRDLVRIAETKGSQHNKCCLELAASSNSLVSRLRRRSTYCARYPKRELHKDAVPVLGTGHPNDITAAQIDSIAASIKARGSPYMAQHFIRTIKALYNYCLLDRPALADKFGLTHNPADRLGRRRYGTSGVYGPTSSRNRVLDDNEIVAWWPALDDSNVDAQTRIGFKLVLVTAQRPGEVRTAVREHLIPARRSFDLGFSGCAPVCVPSGARPPHQPRARDTAAVDG